MRPKSDARTVRERYSAVADRFDDRVAGVPAGRWDDPAPCEGWVALDVVRHLAEWLPGFFARWDVEFEPLPDEPVARWHRVDDVIRAGLADPEVAARVRDTPLGPRTFLEAVGDFCLGDVLVHTWDLARATGQDETLDPDEVRMMHETMLPADEMIRGEHFGPKVPVPDDADDQTKLLAFVGRTP